MKILDRYLTTLFLKNWLVGISAMGGLYLFQSMFTDLYERQYTVVQILTFHGLNIPLTIVEMAPAATLVATVLTLAGLSRSHELTALLSIGMSLTRIMTLLMTLVLMLSFVLLMMQDRILPQFFRLRTTYKYHTLLDQPDFFLDVKRDKIWYRSKNMIYNLRRFDSQAKTILGMSIFTMDQDFQLKQVIDAEKAVYDEQGWRLLNGTVTVFTEDNQFPLSSHFDEKQILLTETPEEFQEIEKEVDGLRIRELNNYIRKLKDSGADTKSYEVKLHNRISLSFVPLIMGILAVPFAVGRQRTGGIARDLGLCLMITFSYWLFYSAGLSLGTKGALPPWLAAWLPSIFFGVLGVLLLARKKSV